jgi:hypothetical protein
VVVDSAAWLDELPEDLGPQVAVLRGLVAAARADPRFRALQVQGSIGRGAPDRYSDLDVGAVVSEAGWPVIFDDLPALFAGLGEIVDEHYEFLPSLAAPEVLRAWAQFTNGAQLDMLVLPPHRVLGSGPDGRTLFDPDGILPVTDHPMRLTETNLVGKWAFLCWHNLDEAVKNIERGRYVAAAEWLASARLATLSCWAVANDAEFAGLAIVVAARLGISCPWLDGLERTYAGPERGPLIAAGLALAELQARVESILAQRTNVQPRPLGRWVQARLESLGNSAGEH